MKICSDIDLVNVTYYLLISMNLFFVFLDKISSVFEWLPSGVKLKVKVKQGMWQRFLH